MVIVGNWRLVILMSLVTLLQVPVRATIFYVDPSNGDMSNDGSFAAPWRSLQEVFDLNLIETKSYSPLPYSSASTLVVKNSGSPVKAGDTLMLRNGFHGSIFYRGIYNDDYVTIMNQPGHQPTLSDIEFSAAAKIILDGLVISPENAPSFSIAVFSLLKAIIIMDRAGISLFETVVYQVFLIRPAGD
ncbi:MAG: hypothetical protein IPL46_23460 [Saprospiraceae bacterium]|nr:hypothetical protein [Saprospiraceae bacterium]